MDAVNPPIKPKNSKGSWTYREAITSVRIAILTVNNLENKLPEDDQELILSEIVGVFQRTPKKDSHGSDIIDWRGAPSSTSGPTNSQVNG
jgi:hypothetical protein